MNEPAVSRVHESEAVTWSQVRLAHALGYGVLASIAGSFLTITGGGPFLLAALMLAIASFMVWFRRSTLPGQLTIHADAIEVRRGMRVQRIPKSRVVSAYALTRSVRATYLPPAFEPVVEIELTGGDLVGFQVSSDAMARAIVEDLGFGPGQRRTRMAFGSPARRLFHVFLGAGAWCLGNLVGSPLWSVAPQPSAIFLRGLVAATVMVVSYLALRRLLRAPRVTIGDDGVLYEAGLRRRFVPATTITGVEQRSIAMPLLLRVDNQIPIAIRGSTLDLDRRAAAGRLAHERYVAPEADAQTTQQFARNGRTVAAWRELLRTRGNVGYREAASPNDVATAVLTSPRATPEERVGAAIALRVGGVPGARIRVAASSAVDEGLRVALETVADSDNDEAIERVLRRLTTK